MTLRVNAVTRCVNDVTCVPVNAVTRVVKDVTCFECSVNAVTRVVNNTLRVSILLRVSTLSALHYTKLYAPRYTNFGITQNWHYANCLCNEGMLRVTTHVTRVVGFQCRTVLIAIFLLLPEIAFPVPEEGWICSVARHRCITIILGWSDCLNGHA